MLDGDFPESRSRPIRQPMDWSHERASPPPTPSRLTKARSRKRSGPDAAYGQIIKSYVGEPGIDAARRYSPGYVVAVNRRAVIGAPRQYLNKLCRAGKPVAPHGLAPLHAIDEWVQQAS